MTIGAGNGSTKRLSVSVPVARRRHGQRG
jgi:hypothetical protein